MNQSPSTATTPEASSKAPGMVIIGGGLSAATAAETLRKEGYEGAVTIVADEPEIPYQRPPLSKGFLAGKEGEDALLPLPASWYTENNVTVLTGTAAKALDPAAHTVTLSDGTTLPYAKALIATGAAPRRIPFPGVDLEGVYTFRTKADSVGLHALLEGGGKNVVMIGSGWIGMEIAATATELGNTVALMGLEEVPLSVAIGAELGTVFANRHKEAGVRFELPASAAEIQGTDGHVTSVLTTTGATLPADIVIVAVGVVPNIGLAQDAGLAINNGIEVDASLRTSAEDVFAAGDVANAMHPVTGAYARSEHWANAIASGKVAAKSMLGQDAVLDDIPYFYTDQFDLGMEYSGFGALTKDAQVVVRGDTATGEFIAFWVLDGRVVAGMNVNIWDVQDAIKSLISSRRQVDTAKLADPKTPLEEI
ncbi:NADPH-dependent 2,4-dienoyl-CoA reductase/sulfur reductase-like enzyme [Arthrobacter stackebrandtii]|uniref:NADPH-dependent 2,4-dienoyl-CoA reductase/sulfur reductase-like enzyme n=1 Tax=Arthrobacter stackebrandtii TaxID=272161 RepID=A0ABS4YY25_9MICC|nr:FAD-dependent oxidoreductase [Arthrobacter stackebrandtii]MBP2413688.1 NADPH-dependent 2,4-dienoyl-CoA reductase/sulfur reductase-like enzyme [Arthrobacter stackebrandtii]